jgi:hypothetical protein
VSEGVENQTSQDSSNSASALPRSRVPKADLSDLRKVEAPSRIISIATSKRVDPVIERVDEGCMERTKCRITTLEEQERIDP